MDRCARRCAGTYPSTRINHRCQLRVTVATPKHAYHVSLCATHTYTVRWLYLCVITHTTDKKKKKSNNWSWNNTRGLEIEKIGQKIAPSQGRGGSAREETVWYRNRKVKTETLVLQWKTGNIIIAGSALSMVLLCLCYTAIILLKYKSLNRVAYEILKFK